MKISELWDIVFEEINQKTGHIKGSMLGGRVDFTARNVIIPDPTLKSDEVDLCYLSVLELFKFEIIGLISKLDGVTDEAHVTWYMATINFDERVYQIMKHLVSTTKPRVLIDRPPTINLGSQLCMKIRNIKRGDTENYTMSLPTRILNIMNADFDK